MKVQAQEYWTAGFLDERFPAPVSPLGWSIIGPRFEEYALRDPLRFMGYPGADRIPATRLVNSHPYANVLIFQIIYKPFPESILPADAVRYFPGGDTSWRKRAPYPAGIFDPRLIASLVIHFLRDPLSWSPWNYVAWDRYTREHDRRVKALNEELDSARTPDAIRSVLEGAGRADGDLLRIHRWSLTYADISYRLLARFAGDQAQALISDVPNLTVHANSELIALGELAARRGLDIQAIAEQNGASSDPEFAAALDAFLSRHGHRSFALDIARPTFVEQPSLALNLIPQVPQPDAPSPKAWKSARTQVRKTVAPHLRPLFDLVLVMARRYASLRENQRYYWHKSLAVTRRAYLKLADLLMQSGDLDTPSDIFFLTRAEIESRLAAPTLGRALQETIRSRRAQYAEYEAAFSRSPSEAYPAFLKGDQPLAPLPTGQVGSWQGRGISPGIGRGRVRVILHASDLGRVSRGEVLVAPATDPGWTPVFGQLGALVTERGGILAHGAIVAREHHLPAVAGIPNITLELVDGDQVEVDGSRGIVRKIEL